MGLKCLMALGMVLFSGCQANTAPPGFLLRNQATDAELAQIGKFFPAAWLALAPSTIRISGRGNGALDLTAETLADGSPAWQHLNGTFEVSCKSNCVLTLVLAKPERAIGFAADIVMPDQRLTAFKLGGVAKQGHVTINAQWDSPDMAFDAFFKVAIAARLENSTIDGCARFKVYSTDPENQFAKVASFVGVAADATGYRNLTLSGTVGDVQKRPASHCSAGGRSDAHQP